MQVVIELCKQSGKRKPQKRLDVALPHRLRTLPETTRRHTKRVVVRLVGRDSRHLSPTVRRNNTASWQHKRAAQPPQDRGQGRAKEKIIIVFLGWRALNDDFDEAMVRELVWFLPCPARCSSRDAREFEQKPPLGAWRIIDFLGSKY